jgi:hypothetical protein
VSDRVSRLNCIVPENSTYNRSFAVSMLIRDFGRAISLPLPTRVEANSQVYGKTRATFSHVPLACSAYVNSLITRRQALLAGLFVSTLRVQRTDPALRRGTAHSTR